MNLTNGLERRAEQWARRFQGVNTVAVGLYLSRRGRVEAEGVETGPVEDTRGSQT